MADGIKKQIVNPIVSKSEFVLSLFEQLIGSRLVTAKEKSILGRCT